MSSPAMPVDPKRFPLSKPKDVERAAAWARANPNTPPGFTFDEQIDYFLSNSHGGKR